MSDMDAVTAAKSDQFNADDLIGSEMTVTVTEVIIRAGTEQPITVKLVGHSKVFRPCKTVARIMKAAWGPDSSAYPGRSMVLYTDPEVTWGGMKVGGIRVRAVSHITDPLVIALQEKKGSKKITTVRPLVQAKQADPNAAEKWAFDHIAFVVGAADLERLAAVQASGKKAMDKLATGNTDLHVRVMAAYAKRLDELSPLDDDDPFEPATGRTDEQHGDQFTDDGTEREPADA